MIIETGPLGYLVAGPTGIPHWTRIAPTLPPRTTQPTGWGREADKVAAAEALAARYHAANLATPLSKPLSFR